MILLNLQEAVITRTSTLGINYFNTQGEQILTKIMEKIGMMVPIKSRAKTQQDFDSEKKILDFKIFLLHEQHKDASQVNNRSSAHLMSFVQSSFEIIKNGYSLNQIFDMPILELDKKVFVMAGEKTKRYIQFKKQI